MPGHQFREEECGHGGVALGQIKTGADPAALLAADEDVLLQHQFADIFETDGHFVNLAFELVCEGINEFSDRKGLGNFAWNLARADQMPHEQRKNLVRINKAAVAIDSADAIAVAVGSEARVKFSGENCFAQGIDMRLDGLRVNTPETRIARTANFFRRNSVSDK